MHKRIQYTVSTNQLTMAKLRVFLDALAKEGVPPDSPLMFDLDQCLLIVNETRIMREDQTQLLPKFDDQRAGLY